MIQETLTQTNVGTEENPNYRTVRETSVILHDYTLTKKNNTLVYSQNTNPDLNDGKRHKTRSFIIAHNDSPYPDTTKLKALINIPTKNHSNIKNSADYGSKLGGFCPTCQAMVKSECKNKFGGTW